MTTAFAREEPARTDTVITWRVNQRLRQSGSHVDQR